MARGRRGRYHIRSCIGKVLEEATEPLTAAEIGDRLALLGKRNLGVSNNSISQVLRGAHGIDTNSRFVKHQNHAKRKTFSLKDSEKFTTWVESKRRPRNV